MKTPKSSNSKKSASSRPDPANYHACGKRKYPCPTTYDHLYPSMLKYARFLGLNKKSHRSRHAYYRQMRLLMEYFEEDPATLGEDQIRDYFLYIITEKKWVPNSVRLTVSALKAFYVETLGLEPWDVFAQVNTTDNKTKPDCPTRCEIIRLLDCFPHRRYLTPTKLIYCCGLRMSECLSLTIHDIKRSEQKLIIHTSKGERDRVVPIAAAMIEEIADYWSFHRNPLLIFPAPGQGSPRAESLAKRMHEATAPISQSALGGAVTKAATKAQVKYANTRNLRHSFGTHFCQAGGNILKLQKIMGHSNIETTMIYLHLTHEIEESSLSLVEDIHTGLSLPATQRT